MGFYGETRKNAAIPECISLDRKFRRRTSGTDVFIAAFSEGKNWQDDIIRSVLSEFLISVFQNDLVVSVGDTEISSETLPALVEKYREVIPEVFNYYQAMTSDKAVVISERFQDLGTIELHLLIQKDLHRKILMSRSSGMKIFDQNRISGTIFFAGVCILKDEKINAYFREMENPQHDAWEPERHSEPSAAKKNKQALSRRLKEIVQQYGMQTTLEEVDAEGMGEFLPDDEGVSDGGEKTETISSVTKDFDVAMSDIQTGQKGSENYADSDGAPLTAEWVSPKVKAAAAPEAMICTMMKTVPGREAVLAAGTVKVRTARAPIFIRSALRTRLAILSSRRKSKCASCV